MKKKQDIIQAAERLFYLNGFHATSTDRICSEAQVSTRTLYRYFPSREALTAAVLEARQARFFAALHQPEHPHAVAQMFDVMREWMLEYGNNGCLFLKAWGEYAAEDIALAQQAMAYRHHMRAYIARCVNPQSSPENSALADAVWLLFEGVLTSALVLGAADACATGKAAALQLLSGKT
ncbi:TetR/AcrR family transcriptional regulator [Pantoea sp. BIGb0393]|uniref:TetR/AcrR family transcriptional regulator n=1 Tax=Pantoea nemavictus TaxID=2726955 RepID=A0ABU8PY43_9GAMM|nr:MULTISPECIES: TetR/AcrR family transcriptional regulator [Pantoea]KNC13262.1 transcriptional regulator [Pantoea sp. RIT-PI-b]MBA0038053.1 TetR/AcrR family transcriptional regulator [Pantoea nemavictus]